MKNAILRHSVIVSPGEAFGYLDAAEKLAPHVWVETVIPRDPVEARLLVDEHILHLVMQGYASLSDAERAHFEEVARQNLEGAFDDDAVFVRISTPNDELARSRLSAVALHAGAVSIIPE